MPQSLASLHVHLIFSTKDRAALLREEIRSSLHAYMAGTLEKAGCFPMLINSREDHVHVLFDLGRTVSMSDAVKTVKVGSSAWLKTQTPDLSEFAWQSGYAAFAVSESNLAEVREYIRNQADHHRVRSFQDEFRAFLNRHGLAFDEKYVWD